MLFISISSESYTTYEIFSIKELNFSRSVVDLDVKDNIKKERKLIRKEIVFKNKQIKKFL